MMTNRRGAPKGNLNHLKHGFYSRLIRSIEAGDLPDSFTTNLENEITLLRVMIRRTMELAEGVDDLQDATRVLDALGAASTRLASLLRVQKIVSDNKSSAAEALSTAIQRINEELRRKNGS
jgi:methyl-accepting chemotaxis protein